jgi:hypothetical protein
MKKPMQAARYCYAEHKAVALIVLSFIGMLLMSRYFAFLDEADNCLGALAIVRGGAIYRDFFSQHTPMMYYFVSLLAAVGIDSYWGFRLGFAVLLFIMWMLMYVRYHARFGKITMALFPVFYLLLIPQSWGHMVLSDVIQGHFYMLLFLEIVMCVKVKEMRFSSMIIVSAAVFMTVGVAFVALYSVFFLLAALMLNELKKYVIEKNKRRLFVRHSAFVGIVLAPFAIYAIYIVSLGIADEAIFQMYTFNRTIYSQYIGGFGENAIKPFFDVLAGFFNHMVASLTINPKNHLTLINIVLYASIPFALVKMKKQFELPWSGIGLLFLSIAYTTIRGVSGFHAVSYYCITCLFLAYIVNAVVQNAKTGEAQSVSHFAQKAVAVALVGVLFVASMVDFIPSGYASLAGMANGREMVTDEGLIRVIEASTEPGEPIWLASIGIPYFYFHTDRIPAARAYAIVPWFADQYSDEIISDLERTQPKYIRFDEEVDVWGYLQKDFAAKIYDYIKENYTSHDGANYFRNDIYEDVLIKLGAS